MTNNHISDASDLRRYRTELPNMIDDMPDLSPYAVRLYLRFKRVAGSSSEGACWQSTRTLAEGCNMSIGKVAAAKKELEKRGLIKIEKRKSPAGPGSDYITIVNIWAQNFSTYAHTAEPEACSPNEQDRSYYEQACSPNELKNNHVKKEPIKKEGETPDHDRVVREKPPARLGTPVKLKPGSELIVPLIDVLKLDPDLIPSPLRREIRALAGLLATNKGATPNDVARFAEYWYARDWRGRKGEPPTIGQIQTEWGKMNASSGKSARQREEEAADRELARILDQREVA